MFKITFLNTVYQTKDNETVCKIQYCVHHNKDTESQILEASGKSKCCPKDTFNAEVGKAIAKARAEIKARDNVIKQMKGLAYVIRKNADELDTAEYKAFERAAGNLNKVMVNRNMNSIKAVITGLPPADVATAANITARINESIYSIIKIVNLRVKAAHSALRYIEASSK